MITIGDKFIIKHYTWNPTNLVICKYPKMEFEVVSITADYWNSEYKVVYYYREENDCDCIVCKSTLFNIPKYIPTGRTEVNAWLRDESIEIVETKKVRDRNEKIDLINE